MSPAEARPRGAAESSGCWRKRSKSWRSAAAMARVAAGRVTTPRTPATTLRICASRAWRGGSRPPAAVHAATDEELCIAPYLFCNEMAPGASVVSGAQGRKSRSGAGGRSSALGVSGWQRFSKGCPSGVAGPALDREHRPLPTKKEAFKDKSQALSAHVRAKFRLTELRGKPKSTRIRHGTPKSAPSCRATQMGSLCRDCA